MSELVECPACCDGLIFPGATVGMWASSIPWPEPLQDRHVQGVPCDLCGGAGEIAAEEAEAWEDAQAEAEYGAWEEEERQLEERMAQEAWAPDAWEEA